jgi:hypothetical protein
MEWVEVSISEIKQKAYQFSREGKSWHFHILTPECKLNKSGRYAFVLENTTDKEVFVTYSDVPYMDVGRQLVQLLHQGILEKKAKPVKPSPAAKKIIERARELTSQGKLWHHHMLFPDCIFNDSGKWMIIFEDLENKKILKALSDEEPLSDLKQIETLYYQQKSLK